MLGRIKYQIRDIWQGFYWAYFSTNNKWYRNVIAYDRLQRCFVCSKRRRTRCKDCGCYLIPKAYSCTPTNDCPNGFWLPLVFSPEEISEALSLLTEEEIEKIDLIVKKHEKDVILIKGSIELEIKSVLLIKDDSKADLLKLEVCLKVFNYKTIFNEQLSEIRKERKNVIGRFASLFRRV